MSTTAANQIRAAALKAARAKDSELKRQRTLAALRSPGSHRRADHFHRGGQGRRGVHLARLRRRNPRTHRRGSTPPEQPSPPDRHADSFQHAPGDAGQPARRPGHRPGADQDAAHRTGQTPAAPAPATRCRTRSTRPGSPNRAGRRPRDHQPSTRRRTRRARHRGTTPPKVGSPNSKTSYPPHAKACAGSSKPKTAHHDAHLCSDSRTQPHTPTCLTCPTLEKSSDQHFFRKNTDNRRDGAAARRGRHLGHRAVARPRGPQLDAGLSARRHEHQGERSRPDPTTEPAGPGATGRQTPCSPSLTTSDPDHKAGLCRPLDPDHPRRPAPSRHGRHNPPVGISRLMRNSA